MAISVVIPARNAAATIGATLDSVALQTLSPLEVIVVDDGSTDATARVVTERAAGDPAVRLLRIAPAGPSAARNAGIAAARGSLIAPLDADDLWASDYLDAMAQALAADPAAGFAWCWHHLVDMAGMQLRGPMRFVVPPRALGPLLLSNFVGNGSAAVFRREAVHQAGGYRPVLSDWPGGEDYALLLRIAARHPVAGVARDLVAYRKGPQTLSANQRAARRARLAAVRQAMDDFGGPPLPVLRWVESDALRVEAVACLRGRQFGLALRRAGRAVCLDPRASLRDAALRVANGLRRLLPGGSGGNERPLDGLLLRRMAALAGYEASVRPSQPSILPTTCAAK